MKLFDNILQEIIDYWQNPDELEPETIFAIIKVLEIETKYVSVTKVQFDRRNHIFGRIKNRLNTDAPLKANINENLKQLLKQYISTFKKKRLQNPKAIFDSKCGDDISLYWRLILRAYVFNISNSFS